MSCWGGGGESRRPQRDGSGSLCGLLVCHGLRQLSPWHGALGGPGRLAAGSPGHAGCRAVTGSLPSPGTPLMPGQKRASPGELHATTAPCLQHGHACTARVPRKGTRRCSAWGPTKVASAWGAGQGLRLPATFLFCLGMDSPESVTCLTKLTLKTQVCKWGVDLGGIRGVRGLAGTQPFASPRGNQPTPRSKIVCPGEAARRAFHPWDLWSIQTERQQPRAVSSGVPQGWVCAIAQKAEFPNNQNAGHKGTPQPRVSPCSPPVLAGFP